MDGKISKSLMSLRTQQLLLHDRCTCQKKKKKRNTKAVKVAAVLKCQIGLKRATWICIFEQHVLPQESALLLLHTKTGKDFPLKIKSWDTCMYAPSLWGGYVSYHMEKQELKLLVEHKMLLQPLDILWIYAHVSEIVERRNTDTPK